MSWMVLLMLNNWISNHLNAFQDRAEGPQHYYVEWSGHHVDDPISATYGELSWEGQKISKKKSDNQRMDNFIQDIENQLQLLPAYKQNIFIHIHGLWANRNPFFGEITSALDKHIWSHEKSEYGIIVSIIWDAGFIYNRSRDVAYKKGQLSVPLVKRLKSMMDTTGGKLSILNHSMGNRVFHGMMDQYDLSSIEDHIFNKCILAAADIEATVFNHGEPLELSHKIAKDIIVYRHNTDRTLGVSRLINDDRLGLNGIANLAQLPDNVKLVDVSLLNDESFPAAKISRHRYYYTSPTVRQDILAELIDDLDQTNRSNMNKKSHYKLIFPDK